MVRGKLVAVLVLLVSCADDDATLLVDVRSDLVPGRELVRVRTELLDGESVAGTVEVTADASDDYVVGERVAELEGLSPGLVRVRVSILDADGRAIVGRNVSVRVSGKKAITVVLSRACSNVICPRDTDGPLATECLGSTCVEPDCLGSDCAERECTSGAECGTGATCAQASCADGLCLLTPRDDRCAAGSYCDPTGGCIADDAVPRFGPFPGAGAAGATGVALDRFGNVYVCGAFDGEIDLGGGLLRSAGGRDVFVASFTLDGRPRWSRAFGSVDHEAARDIVVDSADNVTVSGWFTGRIDFGGGELVVRGEDDIFVAGFTADGTHRWSSRFGGEDPSTPFGNDAATALAVGPDGSVAIGGRFRGTVDFGGGAISSVASGFDGFVAVLGSDGAFRWAWRYGLERYNQVYDVVFDDAGNVFAAGYYEANVDLGGGPLPYAGIQDALVVSLDAAGAHRWSRGFGGSGFDWAIGLAWGEGNLYATGHFENGFALDGETAASAGDRDAFIIALDAANGASRWMRTVGGPACEKAVAARVDHTGRLIIVGTFYSSPLDIGATRLSSAELGDVWLAGFDRGEASWAVRFGGPGSDVALDLALVPGGLYLVGWGDGPDECVNPSGQPYSGRAFLQRLTLP